MEKKEKKVYEQPRMEAVEVKMQGLICASDMDNPSRDDNPMDF